MRDRPSITKLLRKAHGRLLDYHNKIIAHPFVFDSYWLNIDIACTLDANEVIKKNELNMIYDFDSVFVYSKFNFHDLILTMFISL